MILNRVAYSGFRLRHLNGLGAWNGTKDAVTPVQRDSAERTWGSPI
jgi:hypothetical protein